MSHEHAGPNREIANLMPRMYNYLTKSDFQTVHYYNGNSFRLSPFQHQGPVSASNRLGTRGGVHNRVSNHEQGATALVRRRQAETEICYLNFPQTVIEAGVVSG